MYEIKLPNGMTVKVVPPEEYRDFISESDAEMDYRAQEAVKAALHRAKVCKKLRSSFPMQSASLLRLRSASILSAPANFPKTS